MMIEMNTNGFLNDDPPAGPRNRKPHVTVDRVPLFASFVPSPPPVTSAVLQFALLSAPPHRSFKSLKSGATIEAAWIGIALLHCFHVTELVSEGVIPRTSPATGLP